MTEQSFLDVLQRLGREAALPGRSGRIARFEEQQALVQAAIEIAQSQLGVAGLEPISRTTGQLLVDQGVVGSVDEGIVLFHDAIGKQRPGLRKVLRKVDERAGRIKPRRLNAQAELVKKRLVPRSKNGKIAKLTPRTRRILSRKLELSKRTRDILAKKPLRAIKR